MQLHCISTTVSRTRRRAIGIGPNTFRFLFCFFFFFHKMGPHSHLRNLIEPATSSRGKARLSTTKTDSWYVLRHTYVLNNKLHSNKAIFDGKTPIRGRLLLRLMNYHSKLAHIRHRDLSAHPRQCRRPHFLSARSPFLPQPHITGFFFKLFQEEFR